MLSGHLTDCCILQRYYEDESEMSEEEEDQEVAVTKRGRAVKLPAKYKPEVIFLPPNILPRRWSYIA